LILWIARSEIAEITPTPKKFLGFNSVVWEKQKFYSSIQAGTLDDERIISLGIRHLNFCKIA